MSPLVIIFLTVFIDLLGFGIIIPLLPFYAESFGATALTVGLLGTSFSLMQFVFSPIWGRLSDRIGRRPIILLGLMGSCVSYLVAGAGDHVAARLPGAHRRRHCRREHSDRAGVHRRRDDARESREGDGDGRRGVRPGLHLRPGAGRPAQPLRAVGADVVRLGAVLRSTSSRPGSCCPSRAPARIGTPGAGPARRRFAERWRIRNSLLLLALYFLVTFAFSGFEATFALFSERRFGFTSRDDRARVHVHRHHPGAWCRAWSSAGS